MTIWIEKYNKDLVAYLKKLLQNTEDKKGFQKVISLVRYYQNVYPDAFKDFKLCTYFGILFPEELLIEYYTSWENYKSKYKSFIHKSFIDRHVFFDKIHNVYMNSEELGRLELKDNNGEFRKYITNIHYLKELKEKQELFYDKMNQVYKNYEFDYAAFSHTYKGSPRFWKNPEKEEVFGIELELKFKNYESKIGFAESIKKQMKPWICEKDGSLDEGSPDGPSLELIGPPLSFEALKDSVNKISCLLDEFNCRKPTNTYALHITTNINNAKNPILAGARFMAIVNDHKYRDFWIKAAGRIDSYNPVTGKSYAQWLKVDDDDINKLMNPIFWNLKWAQKPIDHYYATFLRKGGNSIETRIFKSANTPSLIINRISLIAYLWRFSKSNEKLSNWLDYISNQSKSLTSYLRKNQMIPS